MDATSVVVGLALSIFIVYGLTGLSWFWIRRELEPIRSRRPGIVMLHISGLLAHTIAKTISKDIIPLDAYCAHILAVLLVLGAFFNTAFVLRMLVLLLDFVLAKQTVMIRNVAKPIGAEAVPGVVFKQVNSKSWLVKHRNLFQHEQIWKIFLTGFLIQALPATLLVHFALNVQGLKLSDPHCMDNAFSVRVLLAVSEIIHLIILFSLTFKLRKVQDNFGITKEIIRLSIAAQISIFFAILDLAFDGDLENGFARVFGFRGYQLITQVLPVSCAIFESTYRPTQLSFILQEEIKLVSHQYSKKFSSNADEFKFILRDDRGFEYFRDFMIRELAIENICFWADVEAYKENLIDIPPSELYSMYIGPTALAPINISSKVKDDLRKRFDAVILQKISTKKDNICNADKALSIGPKTLLTMESLEELASSGRDLLEMLPSSNHSQDPSMKHVDLESKKSPLLRNSCEEKSEEMVHVFDQAQKEIFKLMLRDSFLRFKLSNEYKELMLHISMEASFHRASALDVSMKRSWTLRSAFKQSFKTL